MSILDADVRPTFNPTDAPVDEIYGRNRVPEVLVPIQDDAKSDQTVTIWRLAERHKVEDGTGITSSRIIRSNSLGDVERFTPLQHGNSTHKMRDSDVTATPFVSFSRDPENLMEQVVQGGMGISRGLDSVVVQAEVRQDRIVRYFTHLGKDIEVWLTGGLAPDEYTAAYDVKDFIPCFIPEDAAYELDNGKKLSLDGMIKYWEAPEYWFGDSEHPIEGYRIT